MKKIDLFNREIKENSELNEKPLTCEPNGYPNEIGTFAYGFKSIAEANEFAAKTGGHVAVVEWKNGRDFAYYYGETWSAIDVAGFFQNIDDMFVYQNEREVERDSEEFLSEELAAEILSKDLRKNIVIIEDGEIYEVYPKECLFYNYDQKYEAVGVALLGEEYDNENE